MSSKNIELIVKLATNFYNHSPKSGLSNYTPMEVFSNISMPTFFSDMDIKSIREQQEVDIKEYTENLENFQNDIAKTKIDKYFLKDTTKSVVLAEGDLVLIRDPRKLLGHDTPARGPYLVIKNKYGNAFELREILTGNHVLRNSKFLIKLHPDEKLSNLLKSLEGKNALDLNENELVTKIWGDRELVSSPLNCDELQYRSLSKKNYNLRSRR